MTPTELPTRFDFSATEQKWNQPSGLVLLTVAENELREGNVRDARKLFRTIIERYPPSLERLAASSYLRSI